MLLALLLQGTTAAAETTPHAEQMLQDAELASVFFVDADCGWAVGDRGVVWHTEDAGRTWRRQPT
ncbi:MAG: hypothetical protein KDA65_19875, partial [Planctomycetaceae bacterium]|nr:hypothetical protein [Planctomycetaceae bacterium]